MLYSILCLAWPGRWPAGNHIAGLVKLAIDLATLCGSYMKLKTASIDAILLFNFLIQYLTPMEL